MADYNANGLPQMSEKSLDDKKERKQLLNYLAMLDEKLRYMFQNIDPEENFSGEAFRNYIKTKDGLTSLQAKAGEISALVADMEGNFALFRIQVDNIQSTVADNQGRVSQLEQTAESISTRVSNAEGSVSQLEQTADRLRTRISDAEDNISEVEQTADKINWIVRSGTSASNFRLTSTMAELISDNIDLTGYVTIRSLEKSGATEINGDNITTGEISADFLHLYGMMDVYRTETSSRSGGSIGYGSGNDGESTTKGIMMIDAGGENYFIATDSGARMTWNEAYSVYCTSGGVTLAAGNEFRALRHFYCLEDGDATLGRPSYRWDTVYAATGTINTSDRRQKEDISYDMTPYEELFMRLKPVHYKMIGGKSGRTHVGFIAQDIEEGMEGIGMDSKDFAGFIKSPVYADDSDPENTESEIIDYNYSLRYNEFTAINTCMIQKLMRRVEELEKRVEELEEE